MHPVYRTWLFEIAVVFFFSFFSIGHTVYFLPFLSTHFPFVQLQKVNSSLISPGIFWKHGILFCKIQFSFMVTLWYLERRVIIQGLKLLLFSSIILIRHYSLKWNLLHKKKHFQRGSHSLKALLWVDKT